MYYRYSIAKMPRSSFGLVDVKLICTVYGVYKSTPKGVKITPLGTAPAMYELNSHYINTSNRQRQYAYEDKCEALKDFLRRKRAEIRYLNRRERIATFAHRLGVDLLKSEFNETLE